MPPKAGHEEGVRDIGGEDTEVGVPQVSGAEDEAPEVAAHEAGAVGGLRWLILRHGRTRVLPSRLKMAIGGRVPRGGAGGIVATAGGRPRRRLVPLLAACADNVVRGDRLAEPHLAIRAERVLRGDRVTEPHLAARVEDVVRRERLSVPRLSARAERVLMGDRLAELHVAVRTESVVRGDRVGVGQHLAAGTQRVVRGSGLVVHGGRAECGGAGPLLS
mmetsp:Transcript_55736/g.155345  ORF Transcript_55736/g.155345 Transcript_55736/m.155345 type:complete len:218 (-) Transcript_55736:277-930(-)